MGSKGNVLFITIDQLAASALHGPLSQVVPTPNIDRLTASGTRFTQHYTVTVPCGPARASLLTGLYAMNHRSIRNGTPLARHHATLGTEARKRGYEPLLFGYTDTSPDPTQMDPEDPDLRVYEGIAPGFRELTEARLEAGFEWPGYLRSKGYDVPMLEGGPAPELYKPRTPEGQMSRPTDPAFYSAADSDTAYLTDRTLAALDIRRHIPWFAHLTYIRPHPPLVAPEPYNRLIDPETVPGTNTSCPDHPFVDAWFSGPTMGDLYWGFDGRCRDIPDRTVRELRAVYLGLLAEVDTHIGRVLDWLDHTGQGDRTLVILTADHGEMLGEKGMWGKNTVFEPAFHVPLILRDPRVPDQAPEIDALTESVDLMPTILEWIGAECPSAVDGASLLPLLKGERPPGWRDSVLMELDLSAVEQPTRFQTHLGLDTHQAGVTILREEAWKYIHFGGGVPPMLFDLRSDPKETVDLGRNPAFADQVSRMARKLIDRITERRDRRLTGYSVLT